MTDVRTVSDPLLLSRWRALPRGARCAIAAIALLLGVNALLAAAAVAAGRDPGGPTSSSYAAAPRGLAAYADLLEARGTPSAAFARRSTGPVSIRRRRSWWLTPRR